MRAKKLTIYYEIRKKLYHVSHFLAVLPLSFSRLREFIDGSVNSFIDKHLYKITKAYKPTLAIKIENFTTNCLNPANSSSEQKIDCSQSNKFALRNCMKFRTSVHDGSKDLFEAYLYFYCKEIN